MVFSAHKQTVVTKRLVLIWGKRYRVDSSIIAFSHDPRLLPQVIDFATKAGKALTARRVLWKLHDAHNLADGVAKQFHDYLGNVVDLSEAKRLAMALQVVYEKMLALYQRETLPLNFSSQVACSHASIYDTITSQLEIPSIAALEDALKPSLDAFHQACRLSHPEIAGFLTTLFHFVNKNLLGSLTLAEAILLEPYCRFVEEQLYIPCQRLHQAASKHNADSPIFGLVEKLIPLSRPVAFAACRRLQQEYPSYFNRHSKLSQEEVCRSTVRDLDMVQAYLYLCLLENNVAVVKEKLLPLYRLVFSSLDISWELAAASFPILLEVLSAHLTPAEMTRLQPMFVAMQSLFANQSHAPVGPSRQCLTP